MKKNIVAVLILALSAVFSLVIMNSASAQNDDLTSDVLSSLVYPIAELGGCKDQADCKIYCDDSANTAACVDYAEKMNLMSQEDLDVAKKFVASGAKGPGGCNGKNECQTYCEDKDHIDECVSYAEDKGLMPAQELQKAKKVQAAIKKGVKFPSCKNKKECDIYCEDSAHMEECVTFAKEAGLLSDEELVNTDKVLTAVKQGIKPPPCKGKEACDVYCAEESHTEECTNFAVAAGLVTSEEAQIIKKTGGKGPGGCKNKKDCDSYCSISGNQESCLNFALEHNLISQEQFDMIKKGGGPGSGMGPGNGAGQGLGGPGTGMGPGNGAGQGGGGPNQGQGFNPGSGQGGTGQSNPNPVKCIEDCELVGRNCISALGTETDACIRKGRYCREVTCETVDEEGNRLTTAESWRACNLNTCDPLEASCHDAVKVKDNACRTTKDVCVMNCQKASKPTKPTQPTQPTQPGQTPQPPAPPIQPTQPGQTPQPPAPPIQPTQPGQTPQPPTPPTPPSPPAPPTQPTQPTMGYCGDGKCGYMEQMNPALCPQDCGGGSTQLTPPAPPTPPAYPQ